LQSVCEFGADWEAQIVGASRDGSRVLLNTYYGMTYQQGRLVIPVHHVTISLSHFTTASVFYKTFIWNSNERLRRFKSMSLVFADGVNTPFSSKALPLFEQQIKDRLQSSGYSLADSNAEMVLEVTVNEFSPGSRALRTTVGFGAGQAVLKYTARLKDSQGKLLDEMEGGKVYKGTEFNSADNPIFKSDEYIRTGLISSSVSQLSEFIHRNRNRLN